jgi:hypothetical protein
VATGGSLLFVRRATGLPPNYGDNSNIGRARHATVLDSERKMPTRKKPPPIAKVPRYNADCPVFKLVQKCCSSTRSSAFFDWTALGSEAGAVFNAVPNRVSFLNGPLQDAKEVRGRCILSRLASIEHCHYNLFLLQCHIVQDVNRLRSCVRGH